MGKWDLFVDESGTFNLKDKNGKQEHNLVGGFIAPHGVFTPELAQTWYDEICECIRSKFPAGQIENINRCNPWNGRVDFDFAHSKNNQMVKRDRAGSREEWMEINGGIRAIQLRYVQLYAEKIRGIGGCVVIFDDPRAHDFGGNLATYLTIIGKGIVILYNALINRSGDPHTELFLTIAGRDNFEEDERGITQNTRVLTLTADAPINEIVREHYVKTIRNMAYGIAGELLDREEFRWIVEDEAHLNIEPDGQCPTIIPCDFLCNTFYRGFNDEGWNKTQAYWDVYMDREHSIIVPVSTVDRVETSELTEMVGQRSYLHTFLRLGQFGYPADRTAKFFGALNELDPEEQRGFVNRLADHYYIPMRNCSATGEIRTYIEAMDALLGAMRNADGTERIADAGIRALLCANARLYLMSLYIHLGWPARVTEQSEAFKAALRKAPNGREKANLMARFLNWRIVFLTDCFDCDGAEDTFSVLSEYWEHVLEGRNWLLKDEYNIFGAADAPVGEAQEQEYGEEIGSYLQVLTHKMRISSPEAREKYSGEARALYGKYLAQFGSAYQFSRCYQNMCDLEAEMGEFDRAFLYLYNAAATEGGGAAVDAIEFTPESCGSIKRALKEGGNPWLFSRCIRLTAEMAHRGDGRAKLLFEALGGNAMKADSFDGIRNIFLKSIICRKAAVAVLACAPESQWAVADAYYGMAVRTMLEANGATSKAIGFGMLLEWTASLIRREKWPDASVRATELGTRYGAIRDAARREGIRNPFEFTDVYDALTGESCPTGSVQEALSRVSKGLRELMDNRDRGRRQALCEELKGEAGTLFALSRRVAY